MVTHRAVRRELWPGHHHRRAHRWPCRSHRTVRRQRRPSGITGQVIPPAGALLPCFCGRGHGPVPTMLRTKGDLRMARYSGAQWRPISINYNRGGIAPRILIVHIMQGTLAGTDSWFRNPDAQVSAHFGVGKTGTIYQWVDKANRAWHAG